MSAEHRFLKSILPAMAFAALKARTKQWLAECPCGHKRDLWEVGGVHYKDEGEHRKYGRCPSCDTATIHRIRMKTEAEKLSLA